MTIENKFEKIKKICVLISTYSPFPEYGEYFSNPEYYYKNIKMEKKYIFETILIKKETINQQIEELISSKKYDIFINMCDSYEEDRAGIEVCELLEKYNVSYTGPIPKYFEIKREIQKKIIISQNINTPNFQFIYKTNNEEEIKNELYKIHQKLKYPMIIKHYNSYDSIGITKLSKVYNQQQLENISIEFINKYGGALIEEFIEGREFTILAVENYKEPANPMIYNPIEFIFKGNDNFKYFDLKWKTCDMTFTNCKEEKINIKLNEITRKAFSQFKGINYGRIDVRLDNNDEVYFLEINPLPVVLCPAQKDKPDELSSADIILSQYHNGHLTFIDQIIEQAEIRKYEKIKN